MSGGDVTVLLVDDSTVFLDACLKVVRATDGFEVVGTTTSGEEAIERAVELRPGLVLMDVRMPGIGGVAAAERIHGLVPETTLVMVTADSGASVTSGEGVVSAVVNKRHLTPAALRELWRAVGQT